MSLDTVTVVLSVLAKIIESRFLDYPVESIADWHCLLATMPAPSLDARGVRLEDSPVPLAIRELIMSVDQMQLNISCIECTSPRMSDFATLLTKPHAVNDTTRVANDILKFVTDLLKGEFLQVTVDRLVADASRQCKTSPQYEPFSKEPKYKPFEAVQRAESMAFLVAIALTTITIAMTVALIMLSTKMFVRYRHRKWIQAVAAKKVLVMYSAQQERKRWEQMVNAASTGLFFNPAIPMLVRYFIPLVILGNIGFFLSGHLSLGGSVTIILKLAGQSFVADSFFAFSMAKSTVEIWNAGGKELALLILVFSGIWPYTKQLMTLVIWFLPPQRLSVSTRGSVLLWLDCLAKWSILDIFVLVMTLAAFRVSVQSPKVEFLPDGFYSIDLLVIPKWGLYANMIAQLISQISSHFIIHYHRRAVEVAEEAVQSEQERLKIPLTGFEDNEIASGESNDPSSFVKPPPVHTISINDEGLSQEGSYRLCDHAFARPHRGETERLVQKAWVSKGLIGTVACLSVLVIVGCSVPAYSLDILGIVGLLVESGQRFTQATSEYSVFDTVGVLFAQASFTGVGTDYLGLGTLAFLLVGTVLIVPVVQTAALVALWFQPFSKRGRWRLLVTVEALAAWQYAEVFLISVIVASWQLGPVSEYMINAYCGSLSDTFAKLVYYGILSEQDAQCFRVNTAVEPAFYILAVAATLLALLNTFVVNAARHLDRDLHLDAWHKACGSDYEVAKGNENDVATMRKEIEPVPVLFTDKFRWLLRGTMRVGQAATEDGDFAPPLGTPTMTAEGD